jgi:hypothetical protein
MAAIEAGHRSAGTTPDLGAAAKCGVRCGHHFAEPVTRREDRTFFSDGDRAVPFFFGQPDAFENMVQRFLRSWAINFRRGNLACTNLRV